MPVSVLQLVRQVVADHLGLLVVNGLVLLVEVRHSLLLTHVGHLLVAEVLVLQVYHFLLGIVAGAWVRFVGTRQDVRYRTLLVAKRLGKVLSLTVRHADVQRRQIGLGVLVTHEVDHGHRLLLPVSFGLVDLGLVGPHEVSLGGL